jgi:hypothetical protein
VTRRWTLRYEAKPWLANEARKMHYHAEAVKVKQWRAAFGLLAFGERVPELDRVHITVHHECRTARLPDVGAVAPACKAAVDGLVDAGILPDDDPAHVLSLTFTAPRKTGVDALTIEIEEAA